MSRPTDMPSNNVKPVNIADKIENVNKRAIILGRCNFRIIQRIIGAMIKYRKIEKTNGTKWFS